MTGASTYDQRLISSLAWQGIRPGGYISHVQPGPSRQIPANHWRLFSFLLNFDFSRACTARGTSLGGNTASATATATATASIWLDCADLRHLCRLIVCIGRYANANAAISDVEPTPCRPNLACGFEHVRQIAYRRSSSLLSMLDEADRQTACMQVKRRYWRRPLALHATRHICSQSLAPKRPSPIEIAWRSQYVRTRSPGPLGLYDSPGSSPRKQPPKRTRNCYEFWGLWMHSSPNLIISSTTLGAII